MTGNFRSEVSPTRVNEVNQQRFRSLEFQIGKFERGRGGAAFVRLWKQERFAAQVKKARRAVP
ncbi:MAG TPA: hypothetical protein DEP53_12335 [Bacteroidetes bacterium]|nr:hypothetical protein [Bacteroidota bacterium]